MKRKSATICFSLLFLLCATLCIGVYSASPLGANKFWGAVNVDTADVVVYTSYNGTCLSQRGAKNSSSTEITSDGINLLELTQNNSKTITLSIKNLSSETFGIYFYTGASAKTTTTPATSSDIKTTDTIADVINVTLSPYTKLEGNKTIEITITFELNSAESLTGKDLSFSYFLNIETFQSEIN